MIDEVMEDLMDDALSDDVFDKDAGSTDNMTCIFVWLRKDSSDIKLSAVKEQENQKGNKRK